MLDLIARLEAAAEADRELDAAIAVATGIVWKDANPAFVKNAVVCPDDPDWINYDYQGEECTDIALSFTSSIDAALTLVPEGWSRAVDATAPEMGIDVELFGPDVYGREIEVEATHDSEPIATAIAALKARASLSSNVRATPENQEGK